MKRSVKVALVLLVGFLVAGVGLVAASGGDRGGFDHGWKRWQRARSFTVEVAENGTRFTPDSDPLDADGMPLYGNEFITEGYLYPEGTLTCDSDNNCNGVNPDGSPEFPDKVIGIWTCRGWHVADAASTTSGRIINTTQTFAFGDNPTANIITTDGFELADYNLEFERAVTGGTGDFRLVRGQQVQEFLGWNASVGTAQRMTFELKR